MSRIGKKPISIPDKTSYEIKGNTIFVKGSLGEDSCEFSAGIEIIEEEKQIFLKLLPELSDDQRVSREIRIVPFTDCKYLHRCKQRI
jgi:ribosomal protein L6P/L9E